MILETPLSTWGRLANTFSAETQSQQGTFRGGLRLGLPSPGSSAGLGTESRGLRPVSAGHLLPSPRGVAATLKERKGPHNFLVHDPGRALREGEGCTRPVPQCQLWGTPPAGMAAGSPRGRPGAHRPAPAPLPRAEDPGGPPTPRRWPKGPVGRPSRGHRAAALTDLVRHPRPLVTAPRSPRPSGVARAANQIWPRPSREQGPKGGAGRAGRGGGGPTPGLRGPLAPCPARCRCGRTEPGSAAPRAARPQL